MCRYLLNIVDVENLSPERMEIMETYLHERREELENDIGKLEEKLASVCRAQNAIKPIKLKVA